MGADESNLQAIRLHSRGVDRPGHRPISVLDVPVVVGGGEEVAVPLKTLANFVGIDALFEIQAWKIFSKDVLDVRVG